MPQQLLITPATEATWVKLKEVSLWEDVTKMFGGEALLSHDANGTQQESLADGTTLAPLQQDPMMERPLAPLQQDPMMKRPLAPLQQDPMMERPLASLQQDPMMERPLAPLQQDPMME